MSRRAGGQEAKLENKAGPSEEITQQVFKKTVREELGKLKQMTMPEGFFLQGLDPSFLKSNSRPDSNGSNATEDSVGSVSSRKIGNLGNTHVFDSFGNDRL